MKKSNTFSPAITIIAVVVIILAVSGGMMFLRNNSETNTQVQGAQTTSQDTKIEIEKTEINKIYEVKALNTQGKEAKDRVTMNIKSGEKTNEILVKGQPATAKGDSRFLVLNIDLTNSSKERLIVAPLDLVRLIIDDQKRAAEIYSEETQLKGSVVVEPDSSKTTRVGFVLTEDIVKKPKSIQVGEVNEESKEVFEIQL